MLFGVSQNLKTDDISPNIQNTENLYEKISIPRMLELIQKIAPYDFLDDELSSASEENKPT